MYDYYRGARFLAPELAETITSNLEGQFDYLKFHPVPPRMIFRGEDYKKVIPTPGSMTPFSILIARVNAYDGIVAEHRFSDVAEQSHALDFFKLSLDQVLKAARVCSSQLRYSDVPGVPTTTAHNAESGNSSPRQNVLTAYAEAFNLDLEELKDGLRTMQHAYGRPPLRRL